ncbi:unnamed protein product [Anisakis simplex]|uniref:Transposase n=1 Tax=Anisakis simplex TaxID=6269 RepID=A0A0M3JHF6_ANISI|nr:unnamed protein product [Anisakis simplex]
MREKINIYKDAERLKAIAVDEYDKATEEDLPKGPSLAEMLDDLDINADVEMAEE